MKTIADRIASYNGRTPDKKITTEISACIEINNIPVDVIRFYRMEQLYERDFLITIHRTEDAQRVFSELGQNDPRYILLETKRIIVKIFDDPRINKKPPLIFSSNHLSHSYVA